MAITKELWVAYTRIFFVELAYWLISIGMVFVNEYVLDPALHPDLTIFITLFQILFSLSILLTLNYITKIYFDPLTAGGHSATRGHNLDGCQSNAASTSTASKLIDHDELQSASSPDIVDKQSLHCESTRPLPPQEDKDSLLNLFYVRIGQQINIETCKMVFPLSILYIGMLLLNNFCLKYVGVAFYFVSRSLTTVFNVMFTYLLMGEPVSKGALACCAAIVTGFMLGIDQESVIGSLSVMGVLFGVASSLFTSLCTIYTKKTLLKLDKNIWLLVLYNNINAIILTTPLLILHGDIPALISDKLANPSFWTMLSISGVMAFFISTVTNASIKYTSPLTHNISGTAKACLQTVIAVIYHETHKPILWWISNITILVASAAYSRIKQLEMEYRAHMLPQSAQDSSYEALPPAPKTRRTNRRDSSSSSTSSDASEVYFDIRENHSCSSVVLH